MKTPLPAWMRQYKATHGYYPIAGGSDDEGGETPPGTLQVEAPPAEPAPAAEEKKTGFPEGARFTEDDLNKARTQEREKLYGRIETMSEEVKALREEREAEKAAIEEAERQAAEEARRREEAEMETRELLAKKEQEWQAQFEQVQHELAMRDAAMEKEREFQSLMAYRNERLAKHADSIIPELQDLVQGDSPEEIDQSISTLVDRSTRILDDVRQAQQAHLQQMPGTRPTTPPMGPVEQNDSTQQTMTAQDIQSMSMADYAKHRSRIREAASQRVSQSGPYGR